MFVVTVTFTLQPGTRDTFLAADGRKRVNLIA